eukprot:gene12309-8450_t
MSELPISPKKEKDCEVPLNSHGCAPTHHAEPRDWMASFCGCFDDCCGCLMYFRQWSVAKDHKVGFNIPICLLLHFLPCTICCVGASVRSSTRERYNIKGNTCADCCAVYCCTLCAISQIMREMTMMNDKFLSFSSFESPAPVEGLVFLFKLHLDPFPFVYRRYVAAYPPFFPPFFLLKAWLVFFRMGNREHALSFLFFQSLRVISLYQSSCDRGSTYGTAIWWEKKLSLKTSKFSLKTSKFQDANTVLSLPTPLALPTLGTRPQGLSYQYFVAALLEVVQISAPPVLFLSFSLFTFFFSLILPQHVSLSLPRILTPFLNSITVEGLLALSNLLWPPTLSFVRRHAYSHQKLLTHTHNHKQNQKYFRQNMSELPISPKKEKDCEVPLNSHGCAPTHHAEPRDWMASFCGCFDDCCGCLDVWCCLHCQISRQWSVAKDHKVGFNIPICLLLHFLPCTICCVGASVRSSTRERYNIKGNTCADCCAVYCCTLCAISQIMREMTMMNDVRFAMRSKFLSFSSFESPAPVEGLTLRRGLSPFFPPFFLLKAWLVFFRMGNREHALSFLFFQSLRVISLYQSSCDRGSTYGTAIWWLLKDVKISRCQHGVVPTYSSCPSNAWDKATRSLYQYFVAALLEVVQISAPPVRRHAYSHQKLLTHTTTTNKTKKYFRQNMSELPISPKKEKDCEVPLNSHGCAPTHHAEPRDWMASFCGCFDDCCGCLDVWCCLHCQISRQWSVAKDHKVGFNIPICLLLHFLPAPFAASVLCPLEHPERYNIKGNTQIIMREMTMMNEFPGACCYTSASVRFAMRSKFLRYVAAYPLFFPPFFLLKAWLVFFRMGNREHALSFLSDQRTVRRFGGWFRRRLTSSFMCLLRYYLFFVSLINTLLRHFEVVQIMIHKESNPIITSTLRKHNIALSPSYLNSVLKLYYCRRIISIVEPPVSNAFLFGHSLHSLSPSTREKDCEVPLNSRLCPYTPCRAEIDGQLCGRFDDRCGCLMCGAACTARFSASGP